MSNFFTRCVIGVVSKFLLLRDIIVNNYNTTCDRCLFEFPMPPSIDSFRGREDVIQILEDSYFKHKKKEYVLYGIPGIGKSELARQFVNICNNPQNKRFDRVFWVICKKDFNKESQLEEVYEKCKKDRCLFIFDDSLSRQSICKYQPPKNDNYFLLITSHRQDWVDGVETLKLDVLSLESALKVFKSILNENYDTNEDDLYKELVNIVCSVPLGLQIVAGNVQNAIRAYKQTGDTFNLENHVVIFFKNSNIFKEKIPITMANEYTKSIYEALIVLLEKLNNEISNCELKNISIYLLYICSFLNSESIYFEELIIIPNIQDLLEKCICQRTKSKITCEIKKSYNNSLKIFSLNVLTNFLFLNYISDEKYVQIQRLTQNFLRYHLSEQDSTNRHYMSCLQYVFEEINGIQHNKSHIASVMNYAEENVTTLCEFYNIHVQNKNASITENICENLVKYGCIECLKEILKKYGESSMNNIINKLVDIAKINNQEEILAFLENFDNNDRNYDN